MRSLIPGATYFMPEGVGSTTSGSTHIREANTHNKHRTSANTHRYCNLTMGICWQTSGFGKLKFSVFSVTPGNQTQTKTSIKKCNRSMFRTTTPPPLPTANPPSLGVLFRFFSNSLGLEKRGTLFLKSFEHRIFCPSFQ